MTSKNAEEVKKVLDVVNKIHTNHPDALKSRKQLEEEAKKKAKENNDKTPLKSEEKAEDAKAKLEAKKAEEAKKATKEQIDKLKEIFLKKAESNKDNYYKSVNKQLESVKKDLVDRFDEDCPTLATSGSKRAKKFCTNWNKVKKFVDSKNLDTLFGTAKTKIGNSYDKSLDFAENFDAHHGDCATNYNSSTELKGLCEAFDWVS